MKYVAKTKRIATFSIRTSLIAITLIAVLIAAFGARSVRSVRERQIASDIQSFGGRYDYANARATCDLPWHSRLLSHVVYEDFSRISHVSVDGTAVTDDDLSRIALLSHLAGIDVSNTTITDDGLSHLASMPRLRYINAHNTNLTESFVNELRRQRRSLVIDWEP